MTINELHAIMDRAKKECDQFYERELEKEKIRANNEYRKELDKIRNEAYALNQNVGFYNFADMEYDEFVEGMKHYNYEERIKIAYAFFLHIKLLDNIIFEEGEE